MIGANELIDCCGVERVVVAVEGLPGSLAVAIGFLQLGSRVVYFAFGGQIRS